MIAENREDTENRQSRQACKTALVKYLYSEADYASMSIPQVAAALRDRLLIRAKDYCLKYNMHVSEDWQKGLVDEVIGQFMDSREGAKCTG